MEFMILTLVRSDKNVVLIVKIIGQTYNRNSNRPKNVVTVFVGIFLAATGCWRHVWIRFSLVNSVVPTSHFVKP